MPIYDNVKNACKERGISVSELEEKLGFARSSIYKWDKHCPSVEKVSKVADYFGVDIKYFLEEKGSDPSSLQPPVRANQSPAMINKISSHDKSPFL